MTDHQTNAACPQTRRAPWLSAILILANLIVLLLALAALWPVRYTLDLLANLASYLFVTAALMLLLSIVLRRFAAAVPVLIACLALGGLNLAQPRAERAMETGGDDEATVRLLVFNMTVNNDNTKAVLEQIHRFDADVVVLVETSRVLRRMILRDDHALEAFPYRALPAQPRHAPTAILSRWPLETIPPLIEDDAEHIRRVRVAKVQHPETPFVLFGVHPVSPRNESRWHSGNLTIQRIIAQVNELREKTPYPVLVAGDFNATPTGRRSRLLSRETGLRRAQPLWRFHGTWPSHLPGWLRLPIDGAFVSDNAFVHDWIIGDSAGSSHHSVMIELVLPQESANQAPR